MGKVLVTTTTFPRWKEDNTPRFVFDLSNGLARKFDINVLAPHAPNAKKLEKIGKLTINRFVYFFPKSLQKLCYDGGIVSNIKKSLLAKLQVPFLLLSEFHSMKKLIKKDKIGLVHAHWIVPQGFLARILKKKYNVPYIVTVHGSDIFGLRSSLFKKIQRNVIKDSVVCTVNSNATKNEIIRRFPELKNKLELIPMGVDTDFFRKKKVSKKTLGCDNSSLLLFVGRLTEQKGVQYLISAMPEILNSNSNTKLLIIGEGSYMPDLQRIVAELGLRENVDFLGSVSKEKLVDYYNAADLFVYPSLMHKTGTEALGVVLLESLSCGTAVLGSNLGGIKDIIKDRKTGLLCKQRNKRDIADKANLLLRNKNLREKLAKQGQKLVRQNYSWPIIIKKFERIYGAVK